MKSCLTFASRLVVLFLLSSTGSNAREGDEGVQPEPDALTAVQLYDVPFRDYAQDVRLEKIWDPASERYRRRCSQSEYGDQDCNDLLRALPNPKMSSSDLVDVESASREDRFKALVVISTEGLDFDAAAFSTSFETSVSKEDLIDRLDNRIFELLAATGNRIAVSGTLHEIPAVFLNDLTPSDIERLINSQLVVKVRLLEERGTELLGDTYAQLDYGDIYYYYPPLKGLKAPRIAVLEQSLPVFMNNTWVYSDPWCHYPTCMIYGFSTVSMALPWDSSDYYDGPDTCGWGLFGNPVEHATNVNLNLFKTTYFGRMHNARPYFVEFCVEPAYPSTFSTELAWLQTKLVEVTNVSILAVKDEDDPPKPLELAYDFSTWAHETPLFIYSAGNDEQDEIVQRSYNGIIVGGDENEGNMDFSWKNPSTYYTDRELPHVVEDAYYYMSSVMWMASTP